MDLEQLAPAAVAELGRPLGRANDVGEQYRGQDPGRRGARPDAGEELLDVLEDQLGVSQVSGPSVPGSSTSRALGMCSAR